MIMQLKLENRDTDRRTSENRKNTDRDEARTANAVLGIRGNR